MTLPKNNYVLFSSFRPTFIKCCYPWSYITCVFSRPYFLFQCSSHTNFYKKKEKVIDDHVCTWGGTHFHIRHFKCVWQAKALSNKVVKKSKTNISYCMLSYKEPYCYFKIYVLYYCIIKDNTFTCIFRDKVASMVKSYPTSLVLPWWEVSLTSAGTTRNRKCFYRKRRWSIGVTLRERGKLAIRFPC